MKRINNVKFCMCISSLNSRYIINEVKTSFKVLPRLSDCLLSRLERYHRVSYRLITFVITSTILIYSLECWHDHTVDSLSYNSRWSTSNTLHSVLHLIRLTCLRETPIALTWTPDWLHRDTLIGIICPGTNPRTGMLTVTESGSECPKNVLLPYSVTGIWPRDKKNKRQISFPHGYNTLRHLLSILTAAWGWWFRSNTDITVIGSVVVWSNFQFLAMVAFRRYLMLPLKPSKLLGILIGSRKLKTKLCSPAGSSQSSDSSAEIRYQPWTLMHCLIRRVSLVFTCTHFRIPVAEATSIVRCLSTWWSPCRQLGFRSTAH